MPTFSRREMLAFTSLAASAAAFGKITSSVSDSRIKWRPAAYSDVTLGEGPLLKQFTAQHATLLAMDDDALLKPFRSAAGLTAPGPDLGGWYNEASSFDPPADMHGFIPGHSFGQYVSSLARAYAITGNEQTRSKVSRLVEAYAASVSPKFYQGYPLPAYTFDKLNIGLIDAHEFAHDARALRVLDATLDAALPRLPEKALTREEMSARPHPNQAHTWDESYTLPENLFLAWRRGAGDRYRTLASRFLLDGAYFDPLARGENVLPGKHAYSHMNALSSAMQAYLNLGDPKYLKAAQNGFAFIQAQSFATGGWGPDERFLVPGSGALGESLHTTHASFETPCGAYGHFKATRYLLGVTGETRYGDSMERVLYNTILGVLPMQPDGTSFYYADYNFNGGKSYFDYRCPCCSGTMGQITADYGISAYLHDESGPVVNLYVPSTYRWQQRGRSAALHVDTSYPLDTDITLKVSLFSPDTFAIRLRIPGWAEAGSQVAVNGKALSFNPGSFQEITRLWQDGDVIELRLASSVRLEAVDDKHPDLIAVTQGPLALFAVGDRFLPLSRKDLASVRQSGKSANWQVTTRDGSQLFKPYYEIGGEPTRLYHPISS